MFGKYWGIHFKENVTTLFTIKLLSEVITSVFLILGAKLLHRQVGDYGYSKVQQHAYLVFYITNDNIILKV